MSEHIEMESKMYMLYELEAELKRGEEQYGKTIPQYEALIDIVKSSGRDEELPEGFIETTESDLNNIKLGISNIRRRLGYIAMLKDKVASDPAIEGFVTLTLGALGIGLETLTTTEIITNND